MSYQIRVTAAADPPVTLAEAKAHLRVDVDDDNDYITALIEAATTAAENNCDCFFRECEYTFTRHGFPPGRCPIAVPGGKVFDGVEPAADGRQL